jgi:hypothetical protein
MTATGRLSLAIAALALTLGPAAAAGDCWSRNHTVSAEKPAESTPVDMALLLPPVPADSAETTTSAPVPTNRPAQ